ncbi:hypothetical protein HYT23_05460 [Candidatus Pacearchaeota archaeon]|nr:hypothetical protein [Candidatus Pacearchaeota archaeon]
MKKVDNKEIARRIKGYLQRPEIITYALEREGRYKIISGTQGEFENVELLDVVEGRYIDALVYAVQQGRFCGDWCSWDMPENFNHGKVYMVQDNPVRDKEKGNSILKILRENN